MEDAPFNASEDYLVRQSQSINFLFVGLFVFVFMVSLSFDSGGWAPYIYGFCILLLPAAYLLVNGLQNKTVIRINRSGFYYCGHLITDWANFVDAEVTQELPPGRINERHYLQIRYYKTGLDNLYGRKLYLSTTLDKTNGEIVAAIRFYYTTHETLRQASAGS
jgi:hypothetical protein